MKFSLIRHTVAGSFAVFLSLVAGTTVFAIDDPWVAGTGNWNVSSNWSSTFVPDVANDDLPVVNNAGTAQITTAVPQVAGLVIGQIAGDTGTVELSTATGDLTVVNSLAATGGGVVTVGALGTGTLRISGGTGTTDATRPVLTSVELNSGGNLLNVVELSGFAKVATQVSFLRGTTRVTGPTVDYAAATTLILEPTHNLVANITSPTAHSALKSSGPLVAAGTLNATFTADPAFGQTFNVLDANVLVGNFSNFANVPVTGVTTPVLGEVYRVKRATGGTQGNVLQLLRDKVLALEVNRDTGAVSILNPLGGTIQIDGYTITSAAGSLEPGTGNGFGSTWNSLTNQIATGWGQDGTPTGNGLGETKNVGSTNFSALPVQGQSLGNAYDDSNAFFAGGIGATGQDLIFDYSTFGGEVIRGQVMYTGVGKTNSLLLTIDSNGAAVLKNDAPGPITIDSYSILSTGSALVPGGFSESAIAGLSAAAGSNTASAISELVTNPNSPLTLAANASFHLGNIFNTAMPEEGVSLEFVTSSTSVPSNVIYNGIVRFVDAVAGVLGDYNGNGVVDAADYTTWRDNFGGPATALERRDPTNAANNINLADYNFWKSRFGATTGSGVGSLAGTSVPEPSTGLLLFVVVMIAPVARRLRSNTA